MIIDLFLYIFKKGKMYGRSGNVVSRGSGDQDQSGLKNLEVKRSYLEESEVPSSRGYESNAVFRISKSDMVREFKSGELNHISPFKQVGDSNRVSPFKQVGDSNRASPFKQVGDSNRVSPFKQVGDTNRASPFKQVGESNRASIFKQVGESNRASPFKQVGKSNGASAFEQVEDSNRASPSPLKQVGDLNRGSPIKQARELNRASPSPLRQVGKLNRESSSRNQRDWIPGNIMGSEQKRKFRSYSSSPPFAKRSFRVVGREEEGNSILELKKLQDIQAHLKVMNRSLESSRLLAVDLKVDLNCSSVQRQINSYKAMVQMDEQLGFLEKKQNDYILDLE
ncbi:uncharacterized protein LOC111697158 [Eurytemora carolleeae]|uniref:uncharacterized protein LOC111697158 n=1 Tax=Eurytemora carolleeae TaxID=1294199 RepID=UPI000C76A079|nr:uncharacterized protein LOC111697158 [Eurytemora carolleeae]|eukprot:XP_023322829.1 uncharacterized protein LOC111697158 [Eurytemora affinis]